MKTSHKIIAKRTIIFILKLGICLGLDILLQRNLKCDFTTIAVKDRVFKNNPLQALLN